MSYPQRVIFQVNKQKSLNTHRLRVWFTQNQAALNHLTPTLPPQDHSS